MSSLADPAVYLANLGPRLETINDLRDATGAPLMTRGELLVSDLQHGVTPLDLLDVVREEIRKIKQSAGGRTPTIEETAPTAEQMRELLIWIVAHSNEGFILKKIDDLIQVATEDWETIRQIRMRAPDAT